MRRQSQPALGLKLTKQHLIMSFQKLSITSSYFFLTHHNWNMFVTAKIYHHSTDKPTILSPCFFSPGDISIGKSQNINPQVRKVLKLNHMLCFDVPHISTKCCASAMDAIQIFTKIIRWLLETGVLLMTSTFKYHICDYLWD